MSKSNRPRGLFRLARTAKAFLSDDSGAELVQFVLTVPLLLGIVWASIQFWQIMSLRDALQTTVAQVARYVSAYAAPPEELENTVATGDICAGVGALVRAFEQRQGVLGEAIQIELNWYAISDPTEATWENNAFPVPDCASLVDSLLCNDQFGVTLRVRVPWRWVVFGVGESSATDLTLDLIETAVGTPPCQPYCEIELIGYEQDMEAGPNGCYAYVEWKLNCSYAPDHVQVFADNVLACDAWYPPEDEGACYTWVGVGVTKLRVVAWGGKRKTEQEVEIQCHAVSPTETPVPPPVPGP